MDEIKVPSFILGIPEESIKISVKDSSLLSVEEAMLLAIKEGYKGAPHVSPNPLVGCVILDAQGHLLSCGYHAYYGGPHAEVDALQGLSLEQLSGAHVIVTLEPCAHEGKTPSCAKTLARLPIAKVTYGLKDPNPLVSGQGALILQQAGIVAEEFLIQNECHKKIKQELEELCEIFLHNFRHKKIFYALKLASSLDGRMALQNGQSQWLTGPMSRQHSHYLRACYDAVMVGGRTVQLDNPTLNIRHPDLQKQNKVIVLDPQARIVWDQQKVLQAHAAENIFWCIGEPFKNASVSSVTQVVLPLDPAGFFVATDFEQYFWSQGLRSIFIEGGASTISQYIKKNQAQRLYLYLAPQILGQGLGWSESLQIADIKDRIYLKNIKRHFIDDDTFCTGRLNF